MVINNEITLDISKQTQFVKLSIPQGDNIDRVFKINLINGVDTYIIPTTSKVRFEMTGKDGSFIYNNCPVENNQAILEITPAISAEDGRFPAQFKITDSSTGGLIKSFRFHILIHESVDIENAVVNTSEFTALQDMELRVGDIAPAIQAAETATDNANNAADSANDIVNQLEVETLIIWKPYVSTYADIATTYPTPELGWTTQAQDTGIRWRYNGVAWINIGVSTDDKVGDLSTVTTTNKTNVVSAINEVNSQLAETTNKIKDITINIKELGVKGDGTDESELLLDAINFVGDNHYTLLIPKGMIITVDEVYIAAKSNFGIRCEGIIKRLDNSPTIAAILTLDRCTDVDIPVIRFDGNGLNNGCSETVAYTSAQEQKHTLTMAMCDNINIDKFNVKNPCGDGIYITHDSKNITIDNIQGSATAKIGRNIITLIHGDNIKIGHINSVGIGHFDMPGGFDIEPNNDTQVVKNVFIDSVNIISGGANPFSILNANNSKVENIFVDSVNVVIDTINTSGTCAMITGKNVHIKDLTLDGSSGKYNLLNILNQSTLGETDGVYIKKAIGKNGYRGAFIGFGSHVENIELNATFKNLSHDGIALGDCKGAVLNLDIDSVGAARFMINKTTGVSENIKISGNISYRGTGTAAMAASVEPINLINWSLESLDFTGWANNKRLVGDGFQSSVRKMNCPNLTMLPLRPGFEQWRIGDVIYNTNPVEAGTAGSKYIVDKWIAVANGFGSSIWRESRVLTGN